MHHNLSLKKKDTINFVVDSLLFQKMYFPLTISRIGINIAVRKRERLFSSSPAPKPNLKFPTCRQQKTIGPSNLKTL